MPEKTRRLTPLFLSLTCLFVTCLLISNIIAGKLINVYGMTLPAGAILFPVTYIFGDVLTEVYGFRQARLAIWMGFAANALMSLVFIITLALPYPDFWKDQSAYQTVLGFTPRLAIASLAAYFLGEFSNSLVLSKLKILTQGRWLWLRTIGSTVIGEGVDTLVFIVTAFGGLLPTPTLGSMIRAQYLWKLGYEILLTPATYRVVNWIKRKEGLDTFDEGVRYNPFGWETS
ncbi:MAG: queuosine precursor transporter [Firmicutes bacterium]|nr:queuosine precursor transporter [Bacillota bacterium]